MKPRLNGKSAVAALCLAFGLTLLAYGSAQAQSQPEQQHTSKIVLRILSGRTGWRIRFFHEAPNIWLDGGTTENPVTNVHGEIILDVPDSGPHVIRVLPNWYADCRYHGDSQKGNKVEYSISEILEHGIVAGNVCGKSRAKPVPGVLILYVRSRTFKELWEL